MRYIFEAILLGTAISLFSVNVGFGWDEPLIDMIAANLLLLDLSILYVRISILPRLQSKSGADIDHPIVADLHRSLVQSAEANAKRFALDREYHIHNPYGALLATRRILSRSRKGEEVIATMNFLDRLHLMREEALIKDLNLYAETKERGVKLQRVLGFPDEVSQEDRERVIALHKKAGINVEITSSNRLMRHLPEDVMVWNSRRGVVCLVGGHRGADYVARILTNSMAIDRVERARGLLGMLSPQE